jgi:hypothetical protein
LAVGLFAVYGSGTTILVDTLLAFFPTSAFSYLELLLQVPVRGATASTLSEGSDGRNAHLSCLENKSTPVLRSGLTFVVLGQRPFRFLVEGRGAYTVAWLSPLFQYFS